MVGIRISLNKRFGSENRVNFEIKELSSIEKQISVCVPSEEVDITIAAIIAQKRKSLEEKGVSNQKITDGLIFQGQEKEILEQAAEQISDMKVEDTLKYYRIEPINQIQPHPDTPLKKGADFRFSFVAESIPVLELPELGGIEVRVRKVVVTDEDVDWIIQSLREQLSSLESVGEKRKAADSDIAVFDFESQGEFSEVMGMSGADHKLELGTGDSIQDFETIIKSLKPGESTTDIINYPAGFPNPILAGKQVETKVTLKALYRKILPEVDESFAREVTRVETVIEMREILRQRHNHHLAYLYHQDARRRLLDSLMDKTSVPLSPTYIERNLEDMIGHYTMAMQQRGMNITEIAGQIDEKRKEFLPDAEAAAQRQLFLLVVAEKEQIELDQKEVDNEIARLAEAVETTIDQFMKDAEQSGQLRKVRDDLKMQKVMDSLFQKAEKVMVDLI